MAEFVLKDWHGKEKTFDHETIYVRDPEGNLMPFTHGTGTSKDVRYVTFMSYDGLIEYGKKAVAVGDDCADPIARGVFDTPTKESDVQYTYTFYGWATEPNGGADADWNKVITEDKTVYANFASAVRYYTITYYDSDGTTVLKTESLAYGTVPSYKPSKDGVVFDSWTPTLSAVTGDASYTVNWSAKLTFADATWADIARVAEDGTAENHFKLGDTRDITFNNNGETYIVQFMIVGFNHDITEDGGTAGISVLSRNILHYSTVGHNVSGWINKFSGWSGCALRTKLNSNTINMLPSDLIPHIKGVQKISTAAGSTATLETTIDKLWVPSIHEYGLKHNSTAANQGTAYKGNPASYSGLQTKGEIASGYYFNETRSTSSQSLYYCICVNKNFAADYNGPTGQFKIGFCI